MNQPHTLVHQTQQRGLSLLETLIALLVLSLGMLALTRLQTGLRVGADAARERSEAVRLAQLDIEDLRAFTDLDGWAAIVDAATDVTPTGSTTRYTLERVVETHAEPALKAVRITLRWNDRHGSAQQLQLDTLIGGHDPALSGGLTLVRRPLLPP